MNIRMKMQGKRRWQNKLRNLPKAIITESSAENEKIANEMVSAAKRFAPVKTGKLRDSIIIIREGEWMADYATSGGGRGFVKPIAVTAGNSGVYYAHLVEYGTRFAAPHPFFWPAYRLVKARHMRSMRKVHRTAIARSSRQTQLLLGSPQ
jgi:HK97 gp10 family phage protein